jgi:predicted Zn-dependent peptidase
MVVGSFSLVNIGNLISTACMSAVTILFMLKHIQTTLDSGLTVIRVPMESVKSVTVLALCNTGSRYEEPEQFGIAHFFEHMVFKGTQQYENAQVLAAAIDAVGANFNAFTSKEYTGYYVKSASQHLKLALDVVSDMLTTPQLKQEDIDREKGVIIEELNMYVDSPASHIANKFEEMLYSGSGLEHNIIGTKETIKSINADDFISFLQKWYAPGNMVVMVAGDASVVEKDSTLSLVDQMFKKQSKLFKNNRQKEKMEVKKDLSKSPVSSKKLHIENRKTEQAHLIMGWPGLSRGDKQRYAASLLSTIIGGNMSSRLFTEIREKRGLCYYVHSDVDKYHDGGFFGASAGVDQTRVEEAITAIRAEFEEASAGAKPITKEELKKAKDYMAGKLVLGLEDSESVAQFFGMKHLLLDEIHSPEEVLEMYTKVTLEEVQAVLEQLIKPGELRLAVIGPFKDTAKFEALIT